MGPIIKIDSPLVNGRVLANGEMCRRVMVRGFRTLSEREQNSNYELHATGRKGGQFTEWLFELTNEWIRNRSGP
jgi:hypothetical protein